MNSRKRMVGAMAVAATLCTGLAQARDRNDVQWSVSIGGPIGVSIGVPSGISIGLPIYSQPYPVYSQPYPVYTQPAHVYPQRPYWQPHYQQPTRWDRDGDGIPNRHDRVYNPRWDRDGDGIPNRHDRDQRQPRYDRDGDGSPNWQDRQDGRRGR